jgi:hypothetical protein
VPFCNNLAYDFRSTHYQVILLSLSLSLSLSLILCSEHFFFEQCPSTMGNDESRMICLPGNEVPNWFSHQGIGSYPSMYLLFQRVNSSGFLFVLIVLFIQPKV